MNILSGYRCISQFKWTAKNKHEIKESMKLRKWEQCNRKKKCELLYSITLASLKKICLLECNSNVNADTLTYMPCYFLLSSHVRFFHSLSSQSVQIAETFICRALPILQDRPWTWMEQRCRFFVLDVSLVNLCFQGSKKVEIGKKSLNKCKLG